MQFIFEATPHKDRLTALRVPCLHLFRHIAQKFLDIRQYACEISIQSDKKSDGAIHTQSLCGIALKINNIFSDVLTNFEFFKHIAFFFID